MARLTMFVCTMSLLTAQAMEADNTAWVCLMVLAAMPRLAR